jgi:hypothetical protein
MTPASSAEALFICTLQPSDYPTTAQVETAIRASLRKHGGPCGCAAACAAEYGEHPDTAASRMQWALATVAQSSASIARAA